MQIGYGQGDRIVARGAGGAGCDVARIFGHLVAQRDHQGRPLYIREVREEEVARAVQVDPGDVDGVDLGGELVSELVQPLLEVGNIDIALLEVAVDFSPVQDRGDVEPVTVVVDDVDGHHVGVRVHARAEVVMVVAVDEQGRAADEDRYCIVRALQDVDVHQLGELLNELVAPVDQVIGGAACRRHFVDAEVEIGDLGGKIIDPDDIVLNLTVHIHPEPCEIRGGLVEVADQ